MPPTLTGVHSTHERPASLKSFWACFALFFVAGTFLLVICYAIHSVYRSAKVDEDPRMRHKGSEIEKKEVVPEKERPKRSHSPNLSSASLPPSPIPTVYDPTTPTFDRNNIPFFIPPEQLAELPIDPKLAPIGGSFEFVPPSPVTTVLEVEAMPGLVGSSPRFSSGPGTVKYNSEHGQIAHSRSLAAPS
ncbi:hypothetical protein VNI00_010979 [Paramarasmius palmivorus]|uniref:Uncharacterized protein n=1 Tax=Paramarasmius palmivorus TaxID=297713 RepID=A0AAW0CHA5_9AGAR